MTTTAHKNRAASEPGDKPATRASQARLDAGEARVSYTVIPQRGERKVSDKREAITHAALELFVERGFYGTAVPEIADRAGVGAGTIYRYFESKEALVNAIYRQEKVRWAHVVVDDFPAACGRRASSSARCGCGWRSSPSTNPKSFMFLELHHHARYLDAESRAVEARMLELFHAVVANAQRRGELKAGSPRLLMGMVMGAFVGVIRSCVEIDQPLDSADWKLAEQCIWEAIR